MANAASPRGLPGRYAFVVGPDAGEAVRGCTRLRGCVTMEGAAVAAVAVAGRWLGAATCRWGGDDAGCRWDQGLGVESGGGANRRTAEGDSAVARVAGSRVRGFAGVFSGSQGRGERCGQRDRAVAVGRPGLIVKVLGEFDSKVCKVCKVCRVSQ